MPLLKRGSYYIVFDEENETCYIEILEKYDFESATLQQYIVFQRLYKT